MKRSVANTGGSHCIRTHYQNVHSINDRNRKTPEPTGMTYQEAFSYVPPFFCKPIFAIGNLALSISVPGKSCHHPNEQQWQAY